MFGCYRRSDAADPASYVGAVALVLTHYTAEVVEAVTDPFSGLPARKNERGYSGLPDVADVKQACEEEAAKQLRMANYRAMGKTEFKRLPAPRNTSPGAWANVRIAPSDHRYAAMVERVKHEDLRLWRWDEDGRSIWVGLSLLEDRSTTGETKRFKQYTDDELRAMYAKPADESHVKQDEVTA